MGAVPFTAAVGSGMLHRRGFLASLASEWPGAICCANQGVDWLIVAPSGPIDEASRGT